MVFATLCLIIADDLQRRGVDSGCKEAEAVDDEAVPPPKPKPKGGRSSRAFADNAALAQRVAVPDASAIPATARALGLQHIPTYLEEQADPADIDMIHELYGSRAQTLINILLSWDGFLFWYAAPRRERERKHAPPNHPPQWLRGNDDT